MYPDSVLLTGDLMGWKFIAYLMLNRPSKDCLNSRCSLCSCFFSALDDNFKKKWCSFLRICLYYVFNVSYLIGRVVFTACEMIYLQRVSENHDKSGHKNQNNCPVCPHASGKLQFKLKLRRLLGQCQFSREQAYDSVKMYSSATLVLDVSKRISVLNVKVIWEGGFFILRLALKAAHSLFHDISS